MGWYLDNKGNRHNDSTTSFARSGVGWSTEGFVDHNNAARISIYACDGYGDSSLWLTVAEAKEILDALQGCVSWADDYNHVYCGA